MNKRKLPVISRRQFVGTTIASTLLTLGGSSFFSAVATKRKRPNILFILTDDLGWGDLSIYGKTYQTPNLDQLATEGTRFTNAYAAQTVCTPTRVGFFTGRYPARLPVGLQEPLAGGETVGLPPEHPTIASLLKANGYETALVGKWHTGFLPDYGPLKSGFDEFFGNYSGAIDYFTHKDGNGKLDFYEGEVPVDKPGYATDLYTERAVEFLKKPRNQPFYLSLHYNAPHWPWEGPEDEELSKTFYNSNAFTAGGSPEIYAAILKSLDDGVGRVLQALNESGQADNTIVIFVSDNGGEKYSDIGPFQGRKGGLYEGGIRVPTLIRWPGVIQPNQVSSQAIITFDLTATILAATGTSPDPNYPLDGQNLLPVLLGKKPVYPRTLFWRYKSNIAGRSSGQLQAAVRSGDWKYSDFGSFQGKKGSLYEGGLRVPTFIRWPGVIQPDQVNSQVLITMDLTAIILAATGTSPDPNYPLDGRNLLPVVLGKKPVYPRTLFWRYKSNVVGRSSKELQAAVRNGDWKYLRQGEKEYLFHLATDEGEQIDLKENYPKVLQRLRDRFEEWNGQVLPYPA